MSQSESPRVGNSHVENSSAADFPQTKRGRSLSTKRDLPLSVVGLDNSIVDVEKSIVDVEKAVTRETDKGWALLLEAHAYSHSVGRDPWDFAVEIQSLRRAGLTNSFLRWMVCRGWAKHAHEVSTADKDRRRFRRNGFLSFDRRTCFILTENGVAAARPGCRASINGELRDHHLAAQAGDACETNGFQGHLVQQPRWNAELHQLHVGDVLVKEFKLPCPNQGTILMAFEEEGWPPRIDDPLPPSPDLVPRMRLRYTIKSLNKKQKIRLIRFMGDGTGEGVRWELMASSLLP